MTMCRASARGWRRCGYIFCSAIGKARKSELLARIGGAQRSKQEPNRIGGGRDRKSRQTYSGKFRNGCIRRRQPFRVRHFEVDHEADERDGFRRKAPDSKPADFDQAGERSGRTYQQAPVRGLDMNAVIADEACERQGAGFARPDQRKRETGFAGAGRAADQYGARANQDSRGVQGHHSAGRRTTKRAPSTFGPSGSAEMPMRFSARMRPPCASTIWREMERPSPEFWPKP